MTTDVQRRLGLVLEKVRLAEAGSCKTVELEVEEVLNLVTFYNDLKENSLISRGKIEVYQQIVSRLTSER